MPKLSFALPIRTNLKFVLSCGLLGALLTAVIHCGGQVFAQADQKPQPLEVGKPIERELVGNQQHSYQLALAEGQYLNLVVDQRGIDVVIALFAPDGRKLIEVNSPNGTEGPEPLQLITETAGSYRLEVRSLEKDAKPGKYEAKIIELRVATARDRDLAEADKLYNESESLRVYGLRRALVLAGSETQVMSLWPVSDKGTRDLMIEYYRRLLRGEGRSAALRAVQLQMLKAKAATDEDEDRLLVAKGQQDKDRILKSKTGNKSGEKATPPKLKDYSHPYYWASFIQSGEWANLDGKR